MNITNFGKIPTANFIIQKMKFKKFDHMFTAAVSEMRGKCERTRENRKQIF